MELLVIWVLFGIGAAIIASNKGASGGLWFFLGVLFGPFALLAACFQGKACPHCRSKIHAEAKVCPKCQREVVAGGNGGRGQAAPQKTAWGRRPCPHCGKEVGNDWPQCIHCGQDIRPPVKV